VVSAEGRLKELGIELPRPPVPLGAYVEAVRTGTLLFLSGTLPLDLGVPAFLGRFGESVNLEAGRRACHLATLNALSLARAHLGSIDRVMRVVRLTVSLATTSDFDQHPKVADAASELLNDVFGPDKMGTRMVYGVSSLPAGVCTVVEIILEVRA
jgi:enamine deaminase RidA (YjgF/YER057c/UK114 family)